MYKTLLVSGLGLFFCVTGKAQIGIGTLTPHTSSILDIESSSKGFLPPRVSSHSDISAPIAEGLLIYDESDNCLNIYANGAWTDLCGSSGGSSGVTPSANPNVNMDCSGVFTDISTFGHYAYHSFNTGEANLPFSFHLNTDGSVLYSNYGHYLSSVAPGDDIQPSVKNGALQGTVPVLAVSEKFPGVKWKTFVNIDDPGNSSIPGMLYLLSTDGELKSMNLVEYSSNTGDEQRGTSTTQIEPLNDDDVIHDPGTNASDYRFTPYSHLVNDNDASIKFSSLYAGILNTTSSAYEFAIFPYDNVGKKFYSLGTIFTYGSVQYHSKITGASLHRSVSPANVKESFTLQEADLLNDVITGFSTEFEEGDGKNVTFRYFRTTGNQKHLFFITKDGYVNMVYGSTIYRTQFPAGVYPLSITGDHARAVLASDGNLYLFASATSAAYFSSSRTETFNGRTYTVYERAANLFTPTATDVNNLNIMRLASANSGDIYYALTTDNKLYKIRMGINPSLNAQYGIQTDYYTDYSNLLVKDIIAASSDAVCLTMNGAAFIASGGSSSVTIGVDYPIQGLGVSSYSSSYDTPLDLNGIPLSSTRRSAGYELRLLYNCIGN